MFKKIFFNKKKFSKQKFFFSFKFELKKRNFKHSYDYEKVEKN